MYVRACVRADMTGIRLPEGGGLKHSLAAALFDSFPPGRESGQSFTAENIILYTYVYVLCTYICVQLIFSSGK